MTQLVNFISRCLRLLWLEYERLLANFQSCVLIESGDSLDSINATSYSVL